MLVPLRTDDSLTVRTCVNVLSVGTGCCSWFELSLLIKTVTAAMEHYELVQEMGSVERMATQDRLKHARKRRAQQMKKWGQYERQLEKESSKKKKGQDKHHHQKPPRKSNKGHVKFAPNIALLEAAARNDLAEGGWFCLCQCAIIMIITYSPVSYRWVVPDQHGFFCSFLCFCFSSTLIFPIQKFPMSYNCLRRGWYW